MAGRYPLRPRRAWIPPPCSAALEAIRDGRFRGVDSLVVVRHGRLVAEGYFNGYGPRDAARPALDRQELHVRARRHRRSSRDCSPSTIPSPTTFREFESHANMDARKRAITVRHLLDMSSRPRLQRLEHHLARQRGTHVRHARLGRLHPRSAHGERSRRRSPSYCTGGVIVLGHVISLALRHGARRLRRRPIYSRRSASGSRHWRRSPDGSATGGGGLKLGRATPPSSASST